MVKQYKVRGKTVTVEELEGVRAISPQETARNIEWGLEQMEQAPMHEVNPVVQENWQPFAEAGWTLVKDSPNTLGYGVIEEGGTATATAVMQAVEVNLGRVFMEPETQRILVSNGTLTVKLSPDLDRESAEHKLEELNFEIIERFRFGNNLYQVKPRGTEDYLDLSMDLTGTDDIIYAEPGFIEDIGGRFTPTDPRYADQWHLNNTGQMGGKAGADISAEQAWSTTKGSGIKIAVIDMGFDIAHPDLQAGVSPLSGFFKDDILSGKAVFTNGTAGFPNWNHGTLCAGMALARANNNLHGCGVAPEAEFIAVACYSGKKLGTQTSIARAISYAADPSTQDVEAPGGGADIISCSLGPNNDRWQMESALQEAIDFAVTEGRNGKGTPVFWAVANTPYPISGDQVCSHPNVIAVGRSTNKDKQYNSAFGPELKFLATGVDVLTTSGSGMNYATGASFAAPVAAAIGGLILTVDPSLTWQQVLQIIIDTCDKIGGVGYDATGHHPKYGFGRVNAEKAVAHALKGKSKPATSAAKPAPSVTGSPAGTP